MNKTSLGNFLADLRNEKGLTQEKLAEMLNINYKTISKWECGNSLPTLDTLTQLSEIYNVSLYEFTIYKRINNPLISRNDIKKIINEQSIKRILTIKIILLVIISILTICTLFTYIYTINNYNQMKIYELVSEDNNIEIEGLYVESHDNYYLTINSIKGLNKNKDFSNDKISSLQYELIINNIIEQKNKFKYDAPMELNEALLLINIYLSNINDSPLNNNIYLKLKYENTNGVLTNKTIEITSSKQISNNKLFY